MSLHVPLRKILKILIILDISDLLIVIGEQNHLQNVVLFLDSTHHVFIVSIIIIKHSIYITHHCIPGFLIKDF